MIVGFLRDKNMPPRFARLLSYTCKYNEIELLYMRPQDMDMINGTVQGKMLIDHKWEEREVPIPKFIDVNPHLFNSKKYKKHLKYLKTKTVLSIDRRHIITKDLLQEKLKRDANLKKYAIPSSKINDVKSLMKFLNFHKHIVIKPINGLQGKSVISIEKVNSKKYNLGINKEYKIYNKKNLHKYLANLKIESYMMQKYIESRTKEGYPFDCRVHLEKNKNNKWYIVNTFIRIGIGQTVISNVNQGGGISKTKPFLDYNFEDLSDDIYKSINESSICLAEKLEKDMGSQLMVMGLDVGIDKNGDLYIFEVNSFPIVAPQMSQITLSRAEYYKYMLNKDKKNKSINNVSNEAINIKKLIHDKKLLEKEVNKMKASRSWKLTKPLRLFGRYLKKK